MKSLKFASNIIKIKSKPVKHAPRTVSLQVLGCGALGSPASLCLFTDHNHGYLFNCGEGTQRLAHQQQVKCTRMEHIFLTRATWERTGGLPGLCLTLRDFGVTNLTLHGPDGLGDIFHAMKRFVYLQDVIVKTPRCEGDGIIYDDPVLSVKGISIKKNPTKVKNSENNFPSRRSIVDDTNYYAPECQNAKSKVSPPTVELEKPRAGQVDLEKCVDRGVSPELLAQLKNGDSVVLPDGTIASIEDVSSPSDSGPIFILLDIPSADFLDSLKEKEQMFAVHQADGATCDDDIATVLVHFSPQHVIDDPVYQEFMAKFAKRTKHLVLNETNKFSGLVHAHRLQIELNQLDETIFPILGEYRLEKECHHDTVSKDERLKSDELEVTNDTSPKCERVYASTRYYLRPNKGLNRLREKFPCADEYLADLTSIDGFAESLDELKQHLRQSYADEKISRADAYPKILFLGTGSALPKLTRNPSGILVHTTPTSSILMDCGEGTIGQMIRFYGRDRAREVLKNLKAIYVSHLHADHHIGLIGILEERRRLSANASPVMLLAPDGISSHLNVYDNRINSIRNEFFLVPNTELLWKHLIDDRTAELGLNYISTCFVRHCHHSFGVTFEINGDEPFKITYSGDTVPCNELVHLGKNSTLLIHEATMEDDMADMANEKMHCTIAQAIEQGVKMNAKYTLLTHFSPRYGGIPIIQGGMRANVGIAFDNMEVTSVDLKYLHTLYPTLKLMFSKYCEAMEIKAENRALREEYEQFRLGLVG